MSDERIEAAARAMDPFAFTVAEQIEDEEPERAAGIREEVIGKARAALEAADACVQELRAPTADEWAR